MLALHPEIWRKQLRDASLYWLIIPAMVIIPALFLDRLLRLSPMCSGRIAPLLTLGLFVSGCVLIGKATLDLRGHGGGTPNPLRPPRSLVTRSSYRWCRHPMFLGYDLVALGVGLSLGSWSMLFVTLPGMLAWQFFFLKKEEYLLSRRFREEYAAYKKRTPMLLPWPRPKDNHNRQR